MVHAREIEAANAAGAEAAGYLRADWDHGQPVDPVNGDGTYSATASWC